MGSPHAALLHTACRHVQTHITGSVGAVDAGTDALKRRELPGRRTVAETGFMSARGARARGWGRGVRRAAGPRKAWWAAPVGGVFRARQWLPAGAKATARATPSMTRQPTCSLRSAGRLRPGRARLPAGDSVFSVSICQPAARRTGHHGHPARNPRVRRPLASTCLRRGNGWWTKLQTNQPLTLVLRR